jgi:hypothetical protein
VKDAAAEPWEAAQPKVVEAFGVERRAFLPATEALRKLKNTKKPPRFWRGVRSLACVWRSVLSFLFNDTVSGWAILLTRTHAFFESLAFLPSRLLAVSALSGVI